MSEVVIVDDSDEAGELVAAHIAAQASASRPYVLGAATGSSPLTVYRALARRVTNGLDLSHVECFALDEYVGLPDGHPESYREVLRREVCEPLGVRPELMHTPDGSVDGIHTAGARYEAAITTAGGIDLQLLGVGTDGHIGFNEPGSSLASLTRLKTLTEQTRRDNARFFASLDEVPVHCVTQGIGTILRAGHLVLVAFGASKARAVAAAVEGPVTASVPASAIQLHPRVTVVIDESAAAHLANADYYRYTRAMKPAWQGL